MYIYDCDQLWEVTIFGCASSLLSYWAPTGWMKSCVRNWMDAFQREIPQIVQHNGKILEFDSAQICMVCTIQQAVLLIR